MARMKTGRLTTKTTPPEKYIVTSKRETVKPRELSPKEAKYNADMEAGEKYKSDLGTYNKQMDIYSKDVTTKLAPTSSGGVLYGSGGIDKKNSRLLNPTELADFNKKRKTADYNPDQPDYAYARVNKGIKDPTDPSVFQGAYKKPTAPIKPTAPNERDMPMGRMPLNKVTSIKSRQSMAKGKEAVTEKADFVSPGRNVKKKENVSMNPLAKGAYTQGSGERYVKQVAKSIGKTGENNRGYNKEEKRFKAFAGTTATGDDLSGMTPGEIRDYRSKAKSARAEYRKQPDSELKSMGKAAMTSEIKQSRKAEKFAKQVYNLEGKGGVKFFNDKKYGGPIIKDYKESTQNAANRNTMDAKIKAAGSKAKSRAASFNGQMPL